MDYRPLILYFILLINCGIINSQENLLPYGDFEWVPDFSVTDDHIYCNPAVWHGPPGWFSLDHIPSNDANFFSTHIKKDKCDFSFEVPNTYYGKQIPVDYLSSLNEAYVGLSSGSTRREGIGVKLIEPLKSGHHYKITFYAVNKGGTPSIEIRTGKNSSWMGADSHGTSEIWETGGLLNGEWQKVVHVVYNFKCDIEWFFIRIRGANNRVLIDNISIIDITPADLLCNKIDNYLNPVFINNINHGSQILPLEVKNLGNVDNFTMSITLPNSLLVYRKSFNCADGINGSVFWDGRNSNGAQEAMGFYHCTIETKNDGCGSKKKTFPFEKVHNYTNPTPPDYQCSSCNIKTPKPCCSAQPDIYLENITICGPGTFIYHSNNNLIIGNNVNIIGDAVVIFRAGNEIVGNPFANAEAGADIITEILPCNIEGSGMAVENTNYLNHSLEYSQWDNELESEDYETMQEQISSSTIISNLSFQTQATIFPNPTTGKFTVNITGYQLPKNVLVLNSLGQIIYEIKEFNGQIDIDLSPFSPGIYFVKISDGETVKIEKVVYQR
jgi:hypothetical protein